MPDSWADPTETMAAIAGGTAALLAAALSQPEPPRVWVAASSEVFGNAGVSPQHERSPMLPRSPYGVAKLAALGLVRAMREHHGLFAAAGITYNHESPRRPPQFLPRIHSRGPYQKQLAISPPFLADRFEPDANTALFTMWETDALPAPCVRTLNKAGLVIVPSRWSVDCFRRSGVTAPMEVAPLGCDQLVYNADGSFPEICTFGTAGALAAGGVRKNAQRMIDLFRRAFPGEKNVRLRVKISPSSPAIETHDDPRIDVIRAVLPHAELANWYRSLTAYVNGSFGEGFGLHLIEAMACGRPLITSNYSGLTAFFEPSLGYAIDYKLVPVKNDIYIGQWADPSDDSIVKAMHRVFADRDEASELGERCAARAKNFTWKAAGRHLQAALAKHGFVNRTRSAP